MRDIRNVAYRAQIGFRRENPPTRDTVPVIVGLAVMFVKSLRATTREYTVARLAELEGVFVAFVVEVFANTVKMFVAVLAIFVFGALYPMILQSVVGTEVHVAIVA